MSSLGEVVFDGDPTSLTCDNIVACQRGGVSNKPPGLQTATIHRARDPLVRSQVDGLAHVKYLYITILVIATYKNFKKNGLYI